MAASDATALFDEYDRDYCARATAVAAKIDGVAKLSGGEAGGGGETESARARVAVSFSQPRSLPPAAARADAVRDVEADLNEADQIVR